MKVWRFIRRKLWTLMFLISLFFTLNFTWTHAAVIWMVAKVECPAKKILRARKDVAGLFGHAKAKPLWLCNRQPILGLDVSHGTTRSALFLPSIIVIGKKGARRNVMAHEYAHAELAARMKERYFLMPTWFDEGLAMQVDHRRAYSRQALKRTLRRKGIDKPSLDHLSSTRRFYKRGQARLHYSFARCVVGKWLRAHGSGQPLKLIRDIGWSKPFPIEQFRKYETLCLDAR